MTGTKKSLKISELLENMKRSYVIIYSRVVENIVEISFLLTVTEGENPSER